MAATLLAHGLGNASAEEVGGLLEMVFLAGVGLAAGGVEGAVGGNLSDAVRSLGSPNNVELASAVAEWLALAAVAATAIVGGLAYWRPKAGPEPVVKGGVQADQMPNSGGAQQLGALALDVAAAPAGGGPEMAEVGATAASAAQAAASAAQAAASAAQAAQGGAAMAAQGAAVPPQVFGWVAVQPVVVVHPVVVVQGRWWCRRRLPAAAVPGAGVVGVGVAGVGAAAGVVVGMEDGAAPSRGWEWIGRVSGEPGCSGGVKSNILIH